MIASGEAQAGPIAQFVAADFGLPVFDLSSLQLDSLPAEHIKEDLIGSLNAVPIAKRGSRLFVAISDPTNSEPLDKYKFASGLSVEAVVVEEDKLAELRKRMLDQSASLTEGLDDSFDLDVESGDPIDTEDDTSGVDETPVVRFVNKILLDAIKRGASDIHVEPYEKIFRIRFRIDGILEEVVHPPLAMAGRLTARLKVMSRMDISERRVPQDGRIKLKMSKTKAIDFRVNTCPTLFGEKTVLRILDPSSAQLGIDALGYEPAQKKLYMDALANPYGMILVTGPTGSGKTVSLYTGLNILNEPGTNISTAEDPAEINLAGINQVNVNPKAGLTFAEALKSFLRQDPGRDHGWRDSRSGDGEYRGESRTNRTPCAVDPAHERRTADSFPSDQHGRSSVQHRDRGFPDHRPKAGSSPLRELQDTGGRVATGPSAVRRIQGRARRRHGDLQGQRLQQVQQRLQGARRHLSGHEDQRGQSARSSWRAETPSISRLRRRARESRTCGSRRSTRCERAS